MPTCPLDALGIPTSGEGPLPLGDLGDRLWDLDLDSLVFLGGDFDAGDFGDEDFVDEDFVDSDFGDVLSGCDSTLGSTDCSGCGGGFRPFAGSFGGGFPLGWSPARSRDTCFTWL